jgi:hypothetical protein
MIGSLCALIRIVLLGASAAALFALPAIPVGADTSNSSANLACTITVTTDVHPALTPQVRHTTGTSHGLTGTAICTGTINGQPVAGPGQFKVTTEGDVENCTLSGTARNEFVLRIPTTGGTRTVAGTYGATLAGTVFVLTGDLTGTARVIAAVGDCFTTPITRVTTVLDVHVS